MDRYFTQKTFMGVALTALVIAVFAGCAAGDTSGASGPAGITGKDIQTNIFQDVSDSVAKALMADLSGLVILDVRTPEEYAAGHLENAINIDYRASTFKDELGKLDKSKSYLVYCGSGKRSLESVKIMTELGFSHVYNLLGGITQWQAEGGTMVK